MTARKPDERPDYINQPGEIGPEGIFVADEDQLATLLELEPENLGAMSVRTHGERGEVERLAAKVAVLATQVGEWEDEAERLEATIARVRARIDHWRSVGVGVDDICDDLAAVLDAPTGGQT